MTLDFGPFAAFLLATSIGLGLAVASLLLARRAGLAPVQAALIDTLQDNATALTTRVEQLEGEVGRERQQRVLLEQTVKRLRDTVSDLAAENAELKRKLGAVR